MDNRLERTRKSLTRKLGRAPTWAELNERLLELNRKNAARKEGLCPGSGQRQTTLPGARSLLECPACRRRLRAGRATSNGWDHLTPQHHAKGSN